MRPTKVQVKRLKTEWGKIGVATFAQGLEPLVDAALSLGSITNRIMLRQDCSPPYLSVAVLSVLSVVGFFDLCLSFSHHSRCKIKNVPSAFFNSCAVISQLL